MPMDAEELSTSIIDAMEAEHNATNTDEVVGASVAQTPQEDGTVSSEVEFERGTPPFDRDAITPLARAIAQAVVQHITSNAEVADEDSGAGGTWRIS